MGSACSQPPRFAMSPNGTSNSNRPPDRHPQPAALHLKCQLPDLFFLTCKKLVQKKYINFGILGLLIFLLGPPGFWVQGPNLSTLIRVCMVEAEVTKIRDRLSQHPQHQKTRQTDRAQPRFTMSWSRPAILWTCQQTSPWFEVDIYWLWHQLIFCLFLRSVLAFYGCWWRPMFEEWIASAWQANWNWCSNRYGIGWKNVSEFQAPPFFPALWSWLSQNVTAKTAILPGLKAHLLLHLGMPIRVVPQRSCDVTTHLRRQTFQRLPATDSQLKEMVVFKHNRLNMKIYIDNKKYPVLYTYVSHGCLSVASGQLARIVTGMKMVVDF